MKIECSGPNGETFEAETTINPANGTNSKEAAEQERVAIQKALDTWCEMIAKGAEGEKK